MRSCQKVPYLNSQYQRQAGQQGDISLEDDKSKTGEFSGLMGGSGYHLSLSRLRSPVRIWSGSSLLIHLYFFGLCAVQQESREVENVVPFEAVSYGTNVVQVPPFCITMSADYGNTIKIVSFWQFPVVNW